MNTQQFTSYGQWCLVKRLGQGAFGEVHHWKHCQTGQEIATKRLKANAKLKPDEVDKLHKRWIEEYKWMQNCGTPHIVGAVKIDDNHFLNYLAQQNHFNTKLPIIVMEYCNGGDLRAQLNSVENLNGLTEYNVGQVLLALICAIRHLHEVCNIQHRDIKPENIVSHNQGRNRIYKLTDFGYAKQILDSTAVQSVVGTPNYVAPEVIEPNIYSNKVDYFSTGIVAFEITCGIQPFIPHHNFNTRMTLIKKKRPKCIDIVQKIDDDGNESFEYIDHIKSKSRLSPVFLNHLEKWLQLTLEENYKARGCDENNTLRFYSDIEALLQKKIVTVFSLKTYQKYCYNIESYSSLDDFYQTICLNNQIEHKDKIFFILPPLHPQKTAQKPEHFYVPEWCDTDNPDNPPVMLFVTEFLIQPHCDVEEKTHFNLTETFMKCMSYYPQDGKILPLWQLEEFEREVHFIISNEQHLLECYLMGLQQFIIETENAVFQYKSEMEMLNEKISELNGSVKHADAVSNELLSVLNGKIPKSPTQTSNIKTQEFRTIYNNLNTVYNKLLKNCRELATNKIYERYAKKDVFQLLRYRNSISKKKSSEEERLFNAQNSFEKCVQGFKMITAGSDLIEIRKEIRKQIDTFNMLRFNVTQIIKKVNAFETELYACTRSLIQRAINNSLHLSSLHFDGSISSNSVLNNSLNLFDAETQELIRNFQTILNVMETSMDTE